MPNNTQQPKSSNQQQFNQGSSNKPQADKLRDPKSSPSSLDRDTQRSPSANKSGSNI